MAFPTQSALLVSASTQNYTRADTATLSITGDLTIEVLVKMTTIPGTGTGDRQFMTRKGDSDGNNTSWVFSIQDEVSTLVAYGRIDNASNQTTDRYVALGTFTTGVWYHLAMVYTAAAGGDKIRIYKDGVELTSSVGTPQNNASSIRDANSQINIGAGGFGGVNFNGRLSMMHIWSTTRTAGQLNSCDILGSTANLAAEWTFDNTANDNSGNANTLTPVNTPTYAADVSSTCMAAAVGQRVMFSTLLNVG